MRGAAACSSKGGSLKQLTTFDGCGGAWRVTDFRCCSDTGCLDMTLGLDDGGPGKSCFTVPQWTVLEWNECAAKKEDLGTLQAYRFGCSLFHSANVTCCGL